MTFHSRMIPEVSAIAFSRELEALTDHFLLSRRPVLSMFDTRDGYLYRGIRGGVQDLFSAG